MADIPGIQTKKAAFEFLKATAQFNTSMYVFVKISFYGDQPLNMALAKTPGWLVVQPNAWMDRRVDVHLLLIKQLIFKAHLLSK